MKSKENTLLIKKALDENKSKDAVGNKYTNASESFWEYCKLKNPKFFKESRPHLKEIAEDLQAFYENRIIKFNPDDIDWIILSPEELEALPDEVKSKLIVCVKLMMNLPPRHGKSYILTLFTQWMLGNLLELPDSLFYTLVDMVEQRMGIDNVESITRGDTNIKYRTPDEIISGFRNELNKFRRIKTV